MARTGGNKKRMFLSQHRLKKRGEALKIYWQSKKKNDLDGGDFKPRRKRKQDMDSEEAQNQAKSVRISSNPAPIEEVMIKEEPTDEPVEEVFIKQERIEEPLEEIVVKQEHIDEPVRENVVKPERIDEPVPEIVVKEERLDDYPAYSQAYNKLQLQVKTEEDDEEKCKVPDQSSL